MAIAVRAIRAGFTLIELTVVLGLLGAFLVFLVQLVGSGVSLFDEGNEGQELSDLGSAAAASVRDAFDQMIGPRREVFEPAPPEARLLVQVVPLGLRGETATARVQVVRATIRPDVSEEILRRAAAANAEGGEGDDALRAAAAAPAALADRADMLLLPWPAGDADGAFLELRRGSWRPGERIVLERNREVEPMAIERLETTLNDDLVRRYTQVIATGLLHVEFAFASQRTRSFDRAAAAGGPEFVWDSARAGLLLDAEDGRERFSLDLGPESLQDPTDDVFPRAVRITLVVARQGREAVLSADLPAIGQEARLLTAVPLGDLEGAPLVKIGSEWVRAAGVRGDVLVGLQRGQRGTRALAHAAGSKVRLGRTVVLQVRMAHNRDDWNG